MHTDLMIEIARAHQKELIADARAYRRRHPAPPAGRFGHRGTGHRARWASGG